jgi:ATP-binding cassette subfamily C protein/ATP-binding cassette subfamily C protein LapB
MSAVFNYFRHGSEFFRFIGVESEDTNCSNFANCISPLLFYLGWRGDKRLISDILPQDYNDTTLVKLLNLLIDLKFSISEIETNLASFDGEQVPSLFVLHNDKNRPLVLLEKKIDKWKVFDSEAKDIIDFPIDSESSGTLYIPINDNSSTIKDPICDELDYKRWLNDLFFRHESKWILIFIYSLFVNISTVTTPIFVMVIYDKVVGSKDLLTLKGVILGLFISIVFEIVFRFLRLKSLTWTAVRLDYLISNKIFEKLLYFPFLHLEGSKTSTHFNRTNLFNSIRDFIVSPPGQMLLDIPAIVLYLSVIWYLSSTLVLIPITLVVIYFFLISFVRQKQIFINEQGSDLTTQKQNIIEEIIYQIKNLRKSGLSEIWSKRLDKVSGESSYHKFKTSLFVSNIENVCYSLSMVSGLATLVVGINLVWSEDLTVGGLIGTMMLIWRIISPLQSMATTSGRMNEMNNTLKRIHRIVTYETEAVPSLEIMNLVPSNGDINFKNVGLKFQGSKDAILSGFTMDIKNGQFVTLSGQSGSGKSSVLKLINGMYASQMGNIYIGGLNLKQINEINLRRNISFIGETYHLYDGTLRENLRVANPSATDTELIQSLVESGAWKHISHFNKGLDFNLTSHNNSLPLSLKYQICLSRELLKRPRIILLDQLDNSLFSSECVNDLLRLIEKYKGQITIILVTNRRDLILNSDHFVALLGSGQAVAGKPSELLEALRKNGVEII